MKRLVLALLGTLAASASWAQTDDASRLEQELQHLAQSQHVKFRAMLILSMANELSTIRLDPSQTAADGALPRVLSIAADGLHLAQADGTQLVMQHQSWHGPVVNVHDLARLRQGYQVRMLAMDRVDGRDAVPLRFDPVDRWRYGTTLWVDRSTGLVVKTELRSIDGQTLAQAMLAELEVLDAAQDPVASVATAQVAAPVRWQVKGLPAGFSVITSAPGAEGEQLLVGDGIASVSVFVEPLVAGQTTQLGQQQRGLLATQAEVRGDYQLIAVGAVPPHTIERILNGLTPAD
jgi:negative regulator of sigma E activity